MQTRIPGTHVRPLASIGIARGVDTAALPAMEPPAFVGVGRKDRHAARERAGQLYDNVHRPDNAAEWCESSSCFPSDGLVRSPDIVTFLRYYRSQQGASTTVGSRIDDLEPLMRATLYSENGRDT